MTEPLTPLFEPTRSAALSRLNAFLPHAGRDYAARRNTDEGPGRRENVSMLSPYVSHRLITETEILKSVLGRHSASAADKFIAEVFWRGYFKGWLEHYPNIWGAYKDEREHALNVLKKDKAMRALYDRMTSGHSGYEPMDSWASELIETGYLHNHTRMWFASIWIFTLELPWALGADFFYRHLLDGDPASNTLSWRWVAGLHTQGKTYLARKSNIEQFSPFSADQIMDLASQAPALSERVQKQKRILPQGGQPPQGVRWGWLGHDGDMAPPPSWLDGAPAAQQIILLPEARSPLPISAHVRDFTLKAAKDSLSRWGIKDAPLEAVPDIVKWAAGHELDAVALAYVPTGATQDALAGLQEALAAQNISLHFVMREYDRAVWPHADKGFFKLKNEIPDILRALGLA